MKKLKQVLWIGLYHQTIGFSLFLFLRNSFEFKHIKAYDRSVGDINGPMVLFASPGMLHSGMERITIFAIL